MFDFKIKVLYRYLFKQMNFFYNNNYRKIKKGLLKLVDYRSTTLN